MKLKSLIPLRSLILQATLVAVLLTSQLAFGQALKLTSEPELIKILNSDAEGGEKAMACKRLAVYGSTACIPEVAKLLGNEQLASWARITLEAMPGDASKAALRDAATKVNGLLLVGVINSLGNLRDEAAVEMLSGKLKDDNVDIASAAGLALGRIGNSAALSALRTALPQASGLTQSAIAEGCVAAAEQSLKSGDAKSALETFDLVRNTKLPDQRIVEATRGAILARGEQGVELLAEQLRSPNRKLFAVGLQTAREMSSPKLAAALISEIANAKADRAAAIVEALAELQGKPDLAALQGLASSGSKEVRLAAINVLGRVGDVSCVDSLLKVAKQNADLSASVRAALVALSDEKVNGELLKRLSSAADDKLVLLEVVGLRQIEATDVLVKAVDSADEPVRAAALQALGQTVPQSKLSTLVSQVVSPKRASDAEAAARALKTAAIRMPDREACAATLSEAVKSSPEASKVKLLETIAAVGGTKALQTLNEYAMGKDAALRDASTRLMGEWMTIDVAPVLFDLYTKGPKDKFQIRSIKGYIRVARQFVMPDDQRLEMVKKAMSVAQLPEQKALFDIVKQKPSPGLLQFAIDALKNAELQQEAKATIEAVKVSKWANNPEAQKLLEQAGLK
jgi:HEAT repeat protein